MTLDYTEGTGNDAESATVANVRLNENATKFRADDRSGRARFQAACIFTMLADIGGKSPGELAAGIASQTGHGILFDKLYVAPRGGADRSGVVIGVAAPVVTIF